MVSIIKGLRMNSINHVLLTFAGLLCFSYTWAQVTTLQTTIDSVPYACVGDTLSIPVTVTMGTGISMAAIALSVDYDTTKFKILFII